MIKQFNARKLRNNLLAGIIATSILVSCSHDTNKDQLDQNAISSYNAIYQEISESDTAYNKTFAELFNELGISSNKVESYGIRKSEPSEKVAKHNFYRIVFAQKKNISSTEEQTFSKAFSSEQVAELIANDVSSNSANLFEAQYSKLTEMGVHPFFKTDYFVGIVKSFSNNPADTSLLSHPRFGFFNTLDKHIWYSKWKSAIDTVTKDGTTLDELSNQYDTSFSILDISTFKENSISNTLALDIQQVVKGNNSYIYIYNDIIKETGVPLSYLQQLDASLTDSYSFKLLAENKIPTGYANTLAELNNKYEEICNFSAEDIVDVYNRNMKVFDIEKKLENEYLSLKQQ